MTDTAIIIIASILLAIIAASAIARARRAEARTEKVETMLASMTTECGHLHDRIEHISNVSSVERANTRTEARVLVERANARADAAEAALTAVEGTISDCQTEAQKSVLAKHVARFLNRKANPAPVDWEKSDPKIATILADLRARMGTKDSEG